jgi:hypothetical protein
MTDLLNKAKAFDTKNVPHPDGKKSKKTGEVLKVTQYHFGGKVYSTAAETRCWHTKHSTNLLNP